MNFDSEAEKPVSLVPMMDGSIKLGPIKGAKGREVMTRMLACDLHIPREEGALFTARSTLEGFEMRAEGPGVMGYLVDSEGFEASETDLEYFAKPLLEHNSQIIIEGSHLVDRDIKVLCRTIIERDPNMPSGVSVTFWRSRIGAGIGVDHGL
ncbi:hypothetical protein AB9K35_17680 [Leisingera sp. XS_AS12]|uniref:hypothetical protein n=1 Tax=Leisingera sp. XS_AS12 TaxID=3241294 RepID=UPI003519667A